MGTNTKSQMKVWIISDTHWNHKKILEYENRPANFNEIIIERWNKVVRDTDLVIHLGDVILGHDGDLPGIMAQLRGRKVLCRGNHDHKSDIWFMERGFAFACDYFVYKHIAYSHVPITPLPTDAQYNIHGHFHRGVHRGPNVVRDDYYDAKYYRENQDKYHLIQIEDTLAPFLLENILKPDMVKEEVPVHAESRTNETDEGVGTSESDRS